MLQNLKRKKGFHVEKFIVRSAIGVGVLLGTGYVTRPLWRRSLAGYVNTAEPSYMGDTETPLLWFEITADNQVIFTISKSRNGTRNFYRFSTNCS